MGPTRKIRFLAFHALLNAVAIMSGSGQIMAANERDTFRAQFVADDMCCQGCAQKVAGQLYAAPGVTSVEADIPNRRVKVTASRTAKLTLERLWRAVEKGKGGPSKLITAEATYTLTRPSQLKPDQRLPPGRYVVEGEQSDDQEAALNVAQRLKTVRGVQHVRVDPAESAFYIRCTSDESVSMWTLAAIMEKAGRIPMTIAGPHGLLRVERTAVQSARAAVAPLPGNTTGGVR
jgi:copper chaperone CopZ